MQEKLIKTNLVLELIKPQVLIEYIHTAHTGYIIGTSIEY